MPVKITLIILNTVSIIVCIFWVAFEPTWKSIITLIGLIGTIITLLYSNRENKNKNMNQKGGDGSTNIQVGGNLNIK